MPDAPTSQRSRFRSPLYWLRLLGTMLLAFTVLAAGAIFYFAWARASIDIEPAPRPVAPPPFDVEQVAFTGGDGLTLRGWFIPPQNGATVILLHGYGGSRTAVTFHAEQLSQVGYGVLAYDLRASGESDGSIRSWGWADVRDLEGALAYLRSRSEVDMNRVGIVGISIGGQIALRGAAANPELAAIFADGTAAARAKDGQHMAKPWVRPLVYAWLWAYDRIVSVRAGEPMPPPVNDVVGGIAPRPIYFIGYGVGVVPAYSGGEIRIARRYAQSAGEENTTVWELPDLHHVAGAAAIPDEYARRMIAFFDEHL